MDKRERAAWLADIIEKDGLAHLRGQSVDLIIHALRAYAAGQDQRAEAAPHRGLDLSGQLLEGRVTRDTQSSAHPSTAAQDRHANMPTGASIHPAQAVDPYDNRVIKAREESAAGQVPEGYVAVPREPTYSMKKAGALRLMGLAIHRGSSDWRAEEVYKAMLAAAIREGAKP